ncbi:hypothetical protein DPMN_067031 [Dreissena polymorpha]|uniref:Uncharacterized protein n=1 Tax=Dreissena polymorpha TaxID=45954 RepID=A0A9D3YYI2_DREPO|nr:hypothetical protein DPMN_067031 [Dreissena polymorpha]
MYRYSIPKNKNKDFKELAKILKSGLKSHMTLILPAPNGLPSSGETDTPVRTC